VNVDLRRVAGLALVGIVLPLALAACSDTPPRVNVYGDSLSFESQQELERRFRGEARLTSVAQGGAALCDALPVIEQDLDRRKPAVALIQFSGNNITDCMQLAPGQPLEGQDLVAKYAADAELAVAQLRARDVRVFLVGSPVARSAASITAINAEFQRIAQRWEATGGGVSYVDAGAAVLAPDGSYTPTLPCLPDETAAMGCNGGQIAVRSPDGLHFCPSSTGGTEPCPAYASGARRFADAMAAPVIDELDDGILPGL
jgi:hypothetical protein